MLLSSTATQVSWYHAPVWCLESIAGDLASSETHNSYRHNYYSTLLNWEITHLHAKTRKLHPHGLFFYIQLAGTVSAATEFLYGHTSEKENCSALLQFFQVFTCQETFGSTFYNKKEAHETKMSVHLSRKPVTWQRWETVWCWAGVPLELPSPCCCQPHLHRLLLQLPVASSADMLFFYSAGKVSKCRNKAFWHDIFG